MTNTADHAIEITEIRPSCGCTIAEMPSTPWILAAGVAGSFVLWFALVASLAYAFPPSTDELTTGMDFPGAGRIVWPVVLLLVAATIYLVIAYR